ncbi:MAG: ribonuclease HII [Bacteroidetes bacterium]|jgi:ribonuclease HII|nr:ribonuclease HII [Bacteroidota bacterium]MBT3750108.1 ribonuclease HII [Bacteroidota bacterium]MBT4398866.1 ribonuclease HII [Bacteroidota bacterium]MBT4411623.1 ribonuclease HII [Bacteroidota bacterium]MBT7092203.1 ribonuclease HII [Bacteroidota bacterium]
MKPKLLPYLQADRIEAGCDEAGRGCLAGPVFAAAVILPDGFFHPLLDDSKKLSEKKRITLRKYIEKEAVSWAVAEVSQKKIDEINILNASILAMQKAVELLEVQADFLLIDGHRFKPYQNIPHSCEIKGDGRFSSIAAASVLAKTHRDDYMQKIHLDYPVYSWNKNKGYPTKEHRAGIQKFGITDHHRKSFRLLDEQLEISF